jgi:hypothetical protein
MKRGGIRTAKKYITEKDGTKKIRYEIQGRKGKIWIPVVDGKNDNKPMIYDSKEEAEEVLKAIVNQIRGKGNISLRPGRR